MKLLEFLSQHLKHDKLLHFFIGFFVYLFFQLISSDATALALTFLIATAKELVWDFYLKKGSPEMLDILFSIAPALLIFLL